MKSRRNSNIELLRIVSTLMIIAHHYVYYGIQQNYQNDIANIAYQSGSIINRFWASFLLPGGVVGVGIFFIIAGYFGIEREKISISKIVQSVTFYALFGCIVHLFLNLHNGNQVPVNMIIRSLFPLGESLYWYATVYLILMLVKPYLNKQINTLSKWGLNIFLVLLLVEYFVARLINGHYLGLIQGIFYYSVGAFIKMRIDILNKVPSIFYLFGFLISWLLYIVFDCFVNRFGIIISIVFFGTFCAIFIFLFFETKKPFYNIWINKASKHSFGVYLFHEHMLLREFIWSNLLMVERFQWLSNFFILWSILTILSIFIFGCFFDSLAQKYIYINIGKKVEKYLYGGVWKSEKT